jgi:SnoaL-like protein
MSKHAAISPNEVADRLAIRELVEAYAHCADRRDAKGQMSLFTADTHFVVYMNAKDPNSLPRAVLARGTRSGLCRAEQLRRHHAFLGTEHHLHANGPPGHWGNLLSGASCYGGG